MADEHGRHSSADEVDDATPAAVAVRDSVRNPVMLVVATPAAVGVATSHDAMSIDAVEPPAVVNELIPPSLTARM